MATTWTTLGEAGTTCVGAPQCDRTFENNPITSGCGWKGAKMKSTRRDGRNAIASRPMTDRMEPNRFPIGLVPELGIIQNRKPETLRAHPEGPSPARSRCRSNSLSRRSRSRCRAWSSRCCCCCSRCSRCCCWMARAWLSWTWTLV